MLGKEAVGDQANPTLAEDPILPRHYSQFHATPFPRPLGSVAADGLAAEQHQASGAFSAVSSPGRRAALGLQRDPTAVCSSSKHHLPQIHSSLALWSDGVRGNGQERAGAGSELHQDPWAQPGHNPAQAVCVCLLHSLQCFGSPCSPSPGTLFTGRSQSQGNPGNREIQVMGKSQSLGPGLHLPAYSNTLAGSDGAFPAQTEKKSLAIGKSCNLLSLRPCPRLCPVFLLILSMWSLPLRSAASHHQLCGLHAQSDR